MPRNVLVIEDHRNIANLIRIHLQDFGCEVQLAFDGASGLSEAESKPYDLIILDLMLPGIDGLEICRRLREKERYTPILMLTAKSSEADRVLGLDMGADDYLTKPFSVAELVARVKAFFRRADALASGPQKTSAPEILVIGALVIDVTKREVTLRGKPVNLTATEFALLLHFAQNPGRVFTRSQLLTAVWSYDYTGYEDTVKSHINRLRTKIEQDPANPRYILTVWGVGYRFNDEKTRGTGV
jgi:DNA-binding response OmpR family regulator